MKLTPHGQPAHRFGLWAGLVITALSAQAAIVGPYVPDAKTLHLWHLNEASAPALDAVAGGNNLTGLLGGATLGNVSFAGFGNALNTLDGGQDGIAAGQRDALLATSSSTPLSVLALNYADPTIGAFTYEAIVRIDFDPTKSFATVALGGNGRNTPFSILSAESPISAARIFQFRIMPIGTITGVTTPVLTFENIRVGSAQATIYAPIPTGVDPNAIAQGSWYHVAITYNGLPGTAGNLKFYWTLLDASRTTANLLTISSPTTSLVGLNPVASSYASLAIGNLGSSQTGNFMGLVDEVRMSSVARDASEMMFAVAGNPVVVADPASQTVAVGQTATLSVTVSGEYPLAYQWRKGGSALPGETKNVLTIASAASGDAGTYDVQVTHNAFVATSAGAVLTVRTPRTLAWTGTADGNWETAGNWQDTSDSSVATYITGDDVQFTGLGSSRPSVSLGTTLAPSSITVDNTGFDYTLTGLGRIVGKTGLTKQGTGALSMFNTNTYSGTTDIQNGTLILRNGGVPGTGPMVNNSSLLFQRGEAGAFINNLSGSGTITKWGSVEVTLFGNNTYNGTITIQTNSLSLFGANQTVNSTDIYAIGGQTGATAANWSRVGLSGGATMPATATYHMTSTSTPDSRSSLSSYAGNNNWNAGIILSGSGLNAIVPDNAGTTLTINGNITGTGLSSPAQLSLRGSGKGIIRGTINLLCPVNNLGDWTIASSGNSWLGTVNVQGTLRLGANDALPTTMQVLMGQGPNVATLDLAGFNQTLAYLDQNQSTPASGAFSLMVGNSSTTSDSTLTLTLGNCCVLPWPGVIQDSVAGGTRKTAFTLTGGNFTVTAANTYSGVTTISGGILHLSGAGDIPNSSVINVLSGSIDASVRADGTLTINAAQTLKGNGNISVAGNFANNGTVELKANKSGGVVTCDQVLSGAITYGGTLKVVISGDALAASDTFKVFDASGFSYIGAFAAIEPAVPAVGFAWDTSTMNTDGTLRLVPVLTVTSTTISATGITLSGVSGPAFGSYRVVASTDVSAPLGAWATVQTGSFDGSGAFAVIIPIDSGTPKKFFRVVTP